MDQFVRIINVHVVLVRLITQGEASEQHEKWMSHFSPFLGNQPRFKMISPKITIVSALLALMLSACASLTPEEETALGAEQVEELNTSIKLIDDTTVVAYIDTLMAELVPAALEPEAIKVRIIDSDGFNAFAIGDGNIYITSGTIKSSYNVAELASILAHELAHVIQGDHREFYRSFNTTRTLANVAGVALAIATANPFLIGAGGIASDLGASTYISTHTRKQERAADELAFNLMVDAGYDPRSQLTLFSRLELYRNNRPDIPVFLQTHPIPQERIENTQSRLSALPAGLRLRVDDDGALENIKSLL